MVMLRPFSPVMPIDEKALVALAHSPALVVLSSRHLLLKKFQTSAMTPFLLRTGSKLKTSLLPWKAWLFTVSRERDVVLVSSRATELHR